jgi:hypothetical protein
MCWGPRCGEEHKTGSGIKIFEHFYIFARGTPMARVFMARGGDPGRSSKIWISEKQIQVRPQEIGSFEQGGLIVFLKPVRLKRKEVKALDPLL